MHTRLHSVALLVIAALLLLSRVPVSAGDRARQTEPVTLYLARLVALATYDPQRADNDHDIEAIDNLFLGLADRHPITGEIVPELATSWTVSEDGRVWTFYLRDDVPWVRWDPAAQASEVIRYVTAQDAEYAFKRLCDPRLEAQYTSMAARIIQGCPALTARPLDQITDADYDLVGVRALDDTTLEVQLQVAAGYFLSMVPMWSFHPVPREIIEEYGEEWTNVGTMMTNGPYMLDSWTPGVQYALVRNHLLPADLQGPGNIERVVVTQHATYLDVYPLYQSNLVDATGVPPPEKQAVLDDERYADQRLIDYGYCVHYFGFTHDRPPFDNVHARRAFAAAFDRQRFVDEVIAQGILSPAVPVIHFTPPGLFGAPPIDEVGVGFDPDYALEQLALAGYPGCEGFPELRVLVWEKAGVWGEFLVDRMEEVLGCDPDRLRVEAVQDELYFSIIDPVLPPEGRPDMWTLVWCPDYPDANNYVGDVLGCGSGQPFNRPCTAIDDLIDQAAAASDVLTRTDLYRDIEDRFFGPDGEHPMIPMFMSGTLSLHKPWYNGPFGTDGVFGVPHFDWYTIDQAAQLAARGG